MLLSTPEEANHVSKVLSSHQSRLRLTPSRRLASRPPNEVRTPGAWLGLSVRSWVGWFFCLLHPSGGDLVAFVCRLFCGVLGCDDRNRGGPYLSVFPDALLLAHSGMHAGWTFLLHYGVFMGVGIALGMLANLLPSSGTHPSNNNVREPKKRNYWKPLALWLLFRSATRPRN